MRRLIREAIDRLDEGALQGKRATLGFDGCSDVICRVISNNNNGSIKYLDTIEEFSRYIARMSGLSCSIELDSLQRTAGGNSAIFAGAISGCGVATTVVGTYGKGHIPEVFDALREKCRLYSYHDNTSAFSLEFTDGKIMLAPKVVITGEVWQRVIQAVGEENLEDVFLGPDLLGFVNWGELDYATSLWRDACGFVAQRPDLSRHIMVDLADIMRRTAEDIGGLTSLLEDCAKIRAVTLSLNETEAMELGRHFGLPAKGDYGELCEGLASRIDIHRVVLHATRACYTSENGATCWLPTQFDEAPRLLTGGGDNFNAGYAAGLLLGLRAELCNVYGNSMSSYFIKNGKSPNLSDMRNHMEKWYLELQ